MADTQTRAEYLRIMLGDREKALAPYRPDNINDLGGTSFDAASLSDADIDNAMKLMSQAGQQDSSAFKTLETEQENRKKGQENKSWWDNIVDFVSNLGTSVTEGIFKAVDEVKDFAIGVGAGLFGAGWFGAKNDFTDWAADVIKDDSWIDYATRAVDMVQANILRKEFWTGEGGYWSDWSLENTKRLQEKHYKGLEWERTAGNFVGEMIPNLLLTYFTAGSNLGAQAAAQGGLSFARGYGGAQSQALSEGASFQQSAGYGAVKGTISGGITAAMMGIGGSAFGKEGGIGGKVGDFFGNIAKKAGTGAEIFATKAGQALTYAGFGAINGFSQAMADPVFKQITYDSDAIAEAYGDNERVQKTLTRAGFAALSQAAMSLATSALREGGTRLHQGKEQYRANFYTQKALRAQSRLEAELKHLNNDLQAGKEVNINARMDKIQQLTSEIENYGKNVADYWGERYAEYRKGSQSQSRALIDPNKETSTSFEMSAELKSFENLIKRHIYTNTIMKNIRTDGPVAVRTSYNPDGSGEVFIGKAGITYPAKSEIAIYSNIERPDLPDVEAKLVSGKPVLVPTNAQQMSPIASLAEDPQAKETLPKGIILPLKGGKVEVSIEKLTEVEQLQKLANLTGNDLKKQEDGSFSANLGKGKFLVLSEDGKSASIEDSAKPTETNLTATPTDEEAADYDLSKPEEVDRFLGDTVSKLTEGYNNQDEHWEVQSDKPLEQRLKDLDLAANADRTTAKKYLVDYYKNLKVTYTNSDLDGKTYTYKLTELLTPEERKDFTDEVGKVFDELLEKGNISKNEKVLERLNSTISKYRDRLKTVIAERKEANAKAENTRLLSNQIHKLRANYPLRDSNNETNLSATRGNARWSFVHHIHGKGGSYSLDDNFFKSIEDYSNLVESSDIKESGYYLQEAQSVALLNRLSSALSGVNEVGEDGKITHHSLTSAQEKLILDTIKKIKKIVKVEEKLDSEYKSLAYGVKEGLNQIVDKRGKVGALAFKGLSAYGANFLKPDTAFKLIFGSSNVFQDVLGKDLNDGFNKAMLEYEKNYNEPLEAKFKELKLDKNYFKGTLKFRGKDVPTKALLTIYAASKSKDVVFDKEGNKSVVDGNNLVSLREKGISYEYKKVKHDIYWDDELLEDVEATLPDNYKKMVDWSIEFGNTIAKNELEKTMLLGGGDTANTIQGVYVPKKSDVGRVNFGSAVVSGIRDLHFMNTRTGAVNELTAYNVEKTFGEQYLNTLLTEYLMPVVSKLNGIGNAVVDGEHTLNQVFERDHNLSKWFSKAIDNKVRATLGITDERFKDNLVMRVYNALLRNVGSLALIGKVGPILKQPVSDFAIPGFSNVEMIALAPQEIAILSDKAKMKAINEHNANTFYGARIRNKKNAYASAMLNAEDGLNIVHSIGFKPFSWMDKGAIAFGNAYIAAHLQNARPELAFGSDEYWAASDELTANLYNYSVNHVATNMPIVMNSANPIAKTVSLFQVPNMLIASGVGDVIADVESYLRLPPLEKLKEAKDLSAEASKKAKTEMEEAEKRLGSIQEEEDAVDYSSMSDEEAEETSRDFKKRIDEAAKDYKRKSDDYARAKGKADQDKKNYDFKSKLRPGKAVAHAVSTIVMVSALMVALSEIDKRVRGKKDWDKWDVEDFGKSFVDQATTGWIPGINTLTSTFLKGYDLSASGFDVINDIKDDAQKVIKAWESGTFDRTMIAPIADMVSRAFGVPIKNAYELVYGIIKTFDPATAEQMKSFFYGTSNISLSKLIKSYEAKNDFSTSSKLMQRFYTLYKTGDISHDVAVEVSKLESYGFNPVAKNIPEYIQDEDGGRVGLTEDQRADFGKAYSKANAQVEKLIKTTRYRNSDSETKAKEIKKIYDTYYEAARYGSLGIEPNSRLGKLLAYASDYDDDVVMALYLIQQNSKFVDTLRSTKKEQAIKLVNQQSMSKPQRLLVLYLMGYGVNEESKKSIQKYLVSIGFTKKQAEDFLPLK